jgi:hypothetical protein
MILVPANLDVANLNGLSSVERQRSVLLDDFVRNANAKTSKRFALGKVALAATNRTQGGYLKALEQLFTNQRHIVARETKFHGFVPMGKAEFHHELFDEYSCHDAADPNYTGLLRVWNFGKDLTCFGLEEERARVAGRERAVLGLISSSDPEFHGTFVLRSPEHDRDFTRRYSEVFDRHPDLARLIRYAGQLGDLDLDRRLELSRLLLHRVASLHRMRIAHRDLAARAWRWIGGCNFGEPRRSLPAQRSSDQLRARVRSDSWMEAKAAINSRGLSGPISITSSTMLTAR